MNEQTDWLARLETEREEMMERYKATLGPLMAGLRDLDKQIKVIKRERGELYVAKYWQHHCDFTEEFETLQAARGFLNAMEENGDGIGESITGPGVELTQVRGEDW